MGGVYVADPSQEGAVGISEGVDGNASGGCGVGVGDRRTGGRYGLCREGES